MSNLKFLKKIDMLLENKSNLSLNVLLEETDPFEDAFSEDKDESSDDTSSDNTSSDNTLSDDTSSDDTSSDDSSNTDDSSDDTSSEDTSSDDDSDEEETSGKEVYTTLSDLENSVKTMKSAKHAKDVVKDTYRFDVNKNITGKIVADSFTKKVKVSDLILLEKDEAGEAESTLDKVEKTLEKEQERIEKLSDKSDYINSKLVAGDNINMVDQASSAIHDFENFDSLFSKAEIVANIYIDQIVELSSPKDSEANIKDFLEKFNKLLPDDKKINKQEQPTSYNASAGAKPTA
tara:strand:- start:2129 stop:2998 length:870 start_codon:yes stop_codon:yes gene_type:complete